ncbi:hypothetical protein [Methylocystis parvus]|uniref:hypothetical protein n=1 Tax=Methylocystis parvus TaxID=134 RepID=UPI003C727D3F
MVCVEASSVKFPPVGTVGPVGPTINPLWVSPRFVDVFGVIEGAGPSNKFEASDAAIWLQPKPLKTDRQLGVRAAPSLTHSVLAGGPANVSEKAI